MKQISNRFSIAVHILSMVAVMPAKCTGDFIASSVNTNPVIVRRIMSMLKKAGLIKIRPGVGGSNLLKEPEDISLLDVYRAVDVVEDGHMFNFHKDPSQACPVGKTIEQVLRRELTEAQSAMEQRLSQTSIRQVNEQVLAASGLSGHMDSSL
ncbi:Rrf2 family transcriptional regulator [Cohnella faecalis]|uniref:Rrf2 family transcriptional regulator n=1 Tax=Cohnella faecalis TaxID=2315694 RepID=A0A398CKD4_9BACL|nr:Rrf2 family transcriptional regulator [Cohnella faecalis]RIE00347.1 Rrf2 family transcriptional regulator [Cohnella faecalis]